MLNRRLALTSLVLLLPLAFAALSEGGAYPSRPLEIVAPSNPGGAWDTLARTINRSLEVEKLYPQPISVVNKAGGGGAVGLAYMFTKKGDDYEVVVYSPPLIINTINKTFTQDYKQVTPLAKLITDYQVFIVKADSQIVSGYGPRAYPDLPGQSLTTVSVTDHFPVRSAVAGIGPSPLPPQPTRNASETTDNADNRRKNFFILSSMYLMGVFIFILLSDIMTADTGVLSQKNYTSCVSRDNLGGDAVLTNCRLLR